MIRQYTVNLVSVAAMMFLCVAGSQFLQGDAHAGWSYNSFSSCKNGGRACPAWDDGTYCILDYNSSTYSGIPYYCNVSTQPKICTSPGNSCSSYTYDPNVDTSNDASRGGKLDCEGNAIYMPPPDSTIQAECTQSFSRCG